MCGQPLHVVPTLQEHAADAEQAHADDDPAERAVVAFEWLASETGGPQTRQQRGADRLQHDGARKEGDLRAGSCNVRFATFDQLGRCELPSKLYQSARDSRCSFSRAMLVTKMDGSVGHCIYSFLSKRAV